MRLHALYTMMATLQRLVTDAWVKRGSPFGTVRRYLRERFNSDLRTAPVKRMELRS